MKVDDIPRCFYCKEPVTAHLKDCPYIKQLQIKAKPHEQ